MAPKPVEITPPPNIGGRRLIVVVNQKGGSTKCLAEDTLIPDPVTGVPRTLGDVMTGAQHTQIATLRDRAHIVPAPIAEKVDNGIRPTVTVAFASGRSVTCTPNHPFLTPDGWLHADELTLGHTAALPARLPHPSEPVRLPDAEVTLLALLMAEGGLTGKAVKFSTGDPEMLRRAEDAADQIGWRVRPIASYNYVITGPLTSATNGSCRCGCGQPPSASTYDQPSRGIRTGDALDYTIGHGGRDSGPMAMARRHGMIALAKRKTMPEAVYRLPADQLARFLGVFFMCDGCVTHGGPRITLASEQLVRALQHLLLRFGIQSTFRRTDAQFNGQTFPAWSITVVSQSWQAFAEEIPLWGDKEQRLVDLCAQHGTANLGFPTFTSTIRQRLRELAPVTRQRAGAPSLTMVGERLGYSRFQFDFLVNRASGQVCRRPLKAFAEVFGVEPEFEWLYRADSEIYWDRITSVTPSGEQHVYDLTVDETHCFVANDIIVHNSTTTIGLAYALVMLGLRVRMWDADPQAGSITHWIPPQSPVGEGLLEVYRGHHKPDDVTAITTIENLLIVPSWPSMREVENQRKPGDEVLLRAAVRDSTAEVDVELIDSTHSMNAISLGAVAACTKDPDGNDRPAEILIPLQPDELNLEGMSELLDMIEVAKKYYSPGVDIRAIVIGLANPRAIYEQNILEDFRQAYPEAFVTYIPTSTKMRSSIAAHVPHQLHVRSKKNPVNVQFAGLGQSFVDRWAA